MHGRYYSTKVRPIIKASEQHVGVFTAEDVLFPWTAVKIPKGTVKLISATAIVRPKGDANVTPNPFAMDLWFADDDRVALPAANAVMNAANAGTPTRDLLGRVELAVNGYRTMGANDSVSLVTSGPTIKVDSLNANATNPLVLSPKMELDVNRDPDEVGYSTVYIGGIAKDAFFFTTLIAYASTSGNILTCDGTGMDNTQHIAVGDTIQMGTAAGEAVADVAIGVVSAVATRTITLEDAPANTLADGQLVYNIHPIEIVLAFEY